MSEKAKINSDAISDLLNGLEELKLFALVTEKMHGMVDGSDDDCPFDWISFHKNPQPGPAMWAKEELDPFLITLKPRLMDLYQRLHGALVECWDHFYSIERLSEEAEQARPEKIGVSDFRTVKPESDEEDELQRTFEVMHHGGKDWDFLRGAIDFAWKSSFRERAEFLKKGAAIWKEGVIERTPEPEQAGGEASGQ